MRSSSTSYSSEAYSLNDLWRRYYHLKRGERHLGKPTLPLAAFIREFWHVVEPHTPYVHNWHIDAISEHLEACSRLQIKKLLINVPPGFMKSLVTSVFWPAWEWTFAPWLRYLCASHASELSIRDSLRCRRIVESERYQARFPFVRLQDDQNRKSRFDNTAGGSRIATHVGGATGERGNRRVIDDPHNMFGVHSEALRHADIRWWDEVWSSRIADAATDVEVVIMQRLHEEDLSGHILDDVGGYEHLCLPMEFESTRRCVTVLGVIDQRKQDGELLDAHRFPAAEVEALKRRLGPYGAAGQLQQRPTAQEGGLIKRYWWRFWQYPNQDLPPVRYRTADGQLIEHPVVTLPELELVVQSWDTSFKDTEAADFVAGGVWGVKGPQRFLLDFVNERMDVLACLDAIVDMTIAHPRSSSKFIEDTANGPAVIRMLRNKVSGLIPVSPGELGGSKTARVNASVPQIASGHVLLPHPKNKPEVHALIEQCASFPRGKHDDMVDMITQLLIKLQNYGLSAERPKRRSFSRVG